MAMSDTSPSTCARSAIWTKHLIVPGLRTKGIVHWCRLSESGHLGSWGLLSKPIVSLIIPHINTFQSIMPPSHHCSAIQRFQFATDKETVVSMCG